MLKTSLRDLQVSFGESLSYPEGSRPWRRDARRLAESAWGVDCRAARQALATHVASFFRFLRGDWRRANRLVKSFLNPPDLPLNEVIPLLDTLIKGQNALVAIKSGDSLGRSAFGSQWHGDKSNANELRSLLEWMRGLGPLAKEIREVASQSKNQSAIGISASCLQTVWDECDQLLESAQRDLGWAVVPSLEAKGARASGIGMRASESTVGTSHSMSCLR